MENTQTEKVFVPSLFVRMPNDKAPEYVLLEVSIKPSKEFYDFLEKNVKNGFVNMTIKKSQKGSIYAELNNWVPKTQLTEEQKTTYDNRYHTSPSEDYPKGVDAYNHPLTTDKEREEMDARDALEGLDQLPF